jgi:hypothetical protein
VTTHVTGGDAGQSELARPAIGRRQLVIGVGAVLLGAALSPPGRDLLGRLPYVGSAGAPFDRDVLTEHLGEVFRAVDTGTTIVLDRIEPLPHTVDQHLQFSAVFAARRGVELTADTHRFVSDTFGELPLFVSPIIGGGGVTGYRAIVDRFVPADAPPPPKGAH